MIALHRVHISRGSLAVGAFHHDPAVAVKLCGDQLPLMPRRLLSPHQQRRAAKHQTFGLLRCHEAAVGRVDQLYTLIAHIPELLDKRLHIAVSTGRHQVVDSKCSALFQHAQRFQQKLLLVLSRDIMISPQMV